MICISINKKDVNSVLRAIKKLEFAEIRLDVLNPSINDIRKIFSSHKNLIATMRPCNVTNDKRTDILIQAVRSGARYVDIEMELPSELRKKIIFSARKNNCKIII